MSDNNMTWTMHSNIEFQLLNEDAVLPKRAHDDDAGMDLSSCVNITIPAFKNGLVKTGVAVRLPRVPNGFSCYGRIAPRSGFSLKKRTDIGAGVIDSNYSGELGVVVFNHSCEDIEIKKGDRVAQLIVEICLVVKSKIVDDIVNDPVGRGSNGFGSTGI